MNEINQQWISANATFSVANDLTYQTGFLIDFKTNKGYGVLLVGLRTHCYEMEKIILERKLLMIWRMLYTNRFELVITIFPVQGILLLTNSTWFFLEQIV